MGRRNRKTVRKFEGNKGVAWLNSEVYVLLDVWAEHDIQQQLSGRLHNMCVYEKISERLLTHGIERSAEQCREKIRGLKRDYFTCIENNCSPAYARKLRGCFEKAKEAFGTCCVAKPSSVVESLVLNRGGPIPSTSTDSKELDEPKPSDKGLNSGVEQGREDEKDIAKAMLLMRKFNEIDEEMFSKSQDEFFSKLMSVEQKRLAREVEAEQQRLKLRERLRRRQQERELKLLQSVLTAISSS